MLSIELTWTVALLEMGCVPPELKYQARRLLQRGMVECNRVKPSRSKRKAENGEVVKLKTVEKGTEISKEVHWDHEPDNCGAYYFNLKKHGFR